MRFMLTVAWRNLFRHARRSMIAASAMAFGMAICMAMVALTDGMYAQFYEVLITQKLGHVQAHHPDYPTKRQLHLTLEHSDELLAALDADPLVKAASGRLFGQGLLGGAERSTGGRLVGVVPERELGISRLGEQLREGRFLSSEPKREAVVGQGLFEELELSLGDELVVITQAADGSMGNDLWTVVGTFRTGSSAMDRAGVYVHVEDLRELLALEGQLHELIVTTQDIDDAPRLAEVVKAAVGAQPLMVRTWDEADPQTAQLMASQEVSVTVMLFVVFGIAAIGVLNTMLMAVLERTRELGVLRALGLTPWRLMSLVMLESLLLGAIACVAGGVMGGALDYYVCVYGVDFSVSEGEGFDMMGVVMDPIIRGVVDPGRVVLTISSLFAVCLLASIWPAARAARLSPIEAMREV